MCEGRLMQGRKGVVKKRVRAGNKVEIICGGKWSGKRWGYCSGMGWRLGRENGGGRGGVKEVI